MTNPCRVKASWMPIGTPIYKIPIVYRVPYTLDSQIVEHLGAIKERNDGRWNWWRKRSNYHKSWNGEGQGVADSRGAAELRVLEGWDDTESQD